MGHDPAGLPLGTALVMFITLPVIENKHIHIFIHTWLSTNVNNRIPNLIKWLFNLIYDAWIFIYPILHESRDISNGNDWVSDLNSIFPWLVTQYIYVVRSSSHSKRQHQSIYLIWVSSPASQLGGYPANMLRCSIFSAKQPKYLEKVGKRFSLIWTRAIQTKIPIQMDTFISLESN